jgi:hypothetical protein
MFYNMEINNILFCVKCNMKFTRPIYFKFFVIVFFTGDSYFALITVISNEFISDTTHAANKVILDDVFSSDLNAFINNSRFKNRFFLIDY